MKKITNIKIYGLSLLVVLMSVTSCDDFLDINTDPNNPSDSRLDLLLPTAQLFLFESLGNGSGGMSDLTSQYVHQTVQRVNSNFYLFSGNEFSIANAWPNLYAGVLKDLNVIIEKATERKSSHYLGIALTLKAYTYSMIVDMWGKAPYFEYGQGIDNPFPAYDDGSVIYPELLKMLNAATLEMAKTSSSTPSIDDLVYGGDMTKWIQLANSLKLKLYNQVRLTPLYDAVAVANIIDAGVTEQAVEDGFRLKFVNSNNPENRHPLFIQDYVQNNPNYIDPYFYLIMKGDPNLPVLNPLLVGIEDPRIPYYFYNQLAGGETPQNPVTSAKWGNFLSIWFASLNIDPNEGFDQGQSQTVVGLYPCGGAFEDGLGTTVGVGQNQNPGLGGAGYQRLYPYFAHLYTRAELSLTAGAPGNDRDLFEQAMQASFAEVNDLAPTDKKIPDTDDPDPIQPDKADIEDYVNDVLALYDVATSQGKLELILTQKWIASFGFSIDSYTDYRRTGYPVLFNPATDNNPFTILSRDYPVSIPYYISDLQINPNAPKQRTPGTDKVFWDVN